MKEGQWESDHCKHSCHQLLECRPIPSCFRAMLFSFFPCERRSRKLLPVFTDVTLRLIGGVENHVVYSSRLSRFLGCPSGHSTSICLSFVYFPSTESSDVVNSTSQHLFAVSWCLLLWRTSVSFAAWVGFFNVIFWAVGAFSCCAAAVKSNDNEPVAN